MRIESQCNPNLSFSMYNDEDKFKIFNLKSNLFVKGDYNKKQCLDFINKYKDIDIMDYVFVEADNPSFVYPVFIGMRWDRYEHPLELKDDGKLLNIQR